MKFGNLSNRPSLFFKTLISSIVINFLVVNVSVSATSPTQKSLTRRFCSNLINAVSLRYTRDPVSKQTHSEGELKFSAITALKELDELKVLLRENDVNIEEVEWVKMINDYLRPATKVDKPFLLLTIVGATNAGKSTFFNALEGIMNGNPDFNLNMPRVRTGIQPGLTRRPTLLASEALGVDPLVQRLGAMKPWHDADESSTYGVPLFITSENVPPNIVFSDTPDLESFEQAMRSGSSSLQRSFKGLETAEVVIYIFSKHEIGDPSQVALLKNAFKMWGRRKVILVFGIDDAIDPEIAQEQVLTVGKWFDPNFTIADLSKNTEATVMGAYVLSESTNVFQGLEHPKLIPVGETLPLPQLAQVMDQNVEAIWESVFSVTVHNVAVAAKEQLADVIRRKLLIKLLQQSIDLMIDDASNLVIEDFPYSEARDVLHDFWRSVGSDVNANLRNLSDWTARPEKQFFSRSFLAGRSPFPASRGFVDNKLRAQGVEGAKNQRDIRVLSGLNLFSHKISKGEVILPVAKANETRSEAVRNIEETILKINQLDHNKTLHFTNEGDKLELEIDYKQYSRAIVQALNNVFIDSIESHVSPLSNLLSQVRPPLTDRVSRDLIDHLDNARAKSSRLTKTIDNALPHLHWIVPGAVIGSEFWAHYQANLIQLNPFVYLIPGNVSARLAYWGDRRFIDSILVNEVQKWSLQRQRSIFKNYITTNILGGLYNEIQKADKLLTITDNRSERFMVLLETLIKTSRDSQPALVDR